MKLADFRRIEDLVDELFSIRIENNSNSTISNNKILTSDTTNIFIQRLSSYEEDKVEPSTRGKRPLLGKSTELIKGKQNRALQNVELFSQFLFCNSSSTIKPTVRVYGLFSNLSTNREKKSSTDDYNLLVLEEKSLLEEFISKQYEVRVCISLDIDIITHVWGYNSEQLKSRVIDLCSNLLALEATRPNLRVCFDTHNRMDSTFILGDSILIRAITASSEAGYDTTLYEENQYIVDRAIKSFDDAFQAARERDYLVRKQLQICSIKDYIELLIDTRLAHYKRS